MLACVRCARRRNLRHPHVLIRAPLRRKCCVLFEQLAVAHSRLMIDLRKLELDRMFVAAIAACD
jgi:hypothetical protein